MNFDFFEKKAAFPEEYAVKPEKSEEEIAKKVCEKIDYDSLEEELEDPEVFSRNVVDSLARLVVKLENKLGSYDTILSDDTSGRLASLIFRKVVNSRRSAAGKSPASIYFLRGGRHERAVSWRVIDDFIEKKKPALGKTLLVTEYIETGKSIWNLAKILERQKVDFDLAAVSIQENPEEYRGEVSKHLHYGTIGESGLDMHGTHTHSGVENAPDGISVHPRKFSLPDNVRAARRDVDRVSEELLKLFD